jgi:hypothetical protein
LRVLLPTLSGNVILLTEKTDLPEKCSAIVQIDPVDAKRHEAAV